MPANPQPLERSTDVAQRRLRSQHLTGAPLASAVDAVAWFGAVQAQDFGGAKWALAQRTRDATEADLDALFDAGAIVRTHVLRPTWHFVHPDDVVWLQDLTASRVKAQLTYYDRTVGIDRDLLTRSYAVLEKSLRDRTYRTRGELSAALARADIPVSSQRLGQLLMHAELDGLIVSGPRRGKQLTYALLAERAPTARHLGRDEALVGLTRRYFTSHGPAQVKDFVWWSGLTTTDAKRGLDLVGCALERQVLGDNTYWSAPAAPAPSATSVAHLLPNFDEFLVAYRDRTASLQHALHLTASDVLSNVITVDGQIRGFWKLRRQSDRAILQLTLQSPDSAETLRQAIATLSHYLGLDVRVATPDVTCQATDPGWAQGAQ